MKDSGAAETRPYRIGSCPQCGQSVRLDENNPWRPFCSERCKLVDLGEWFSGGYAIPSDGPFGGDTGGDPRDRS